MSDTSSDTGFVHDKAAVSKKKSTSLKPYSWSVRPNQTKLSLLEFLQLQLEDKGFSRRKVKGFIDAGYCFVQGKCERYGKRMLAVNDRIQLQVVTRAPQPLSVLYEDELIVVINKPPGITCDERLEKSMARDEKRTYLVHRLDKDTTGVVILAKTTAARDALMTQFSEQAVLKRYYALVHASMKPSGVIENFLGPIERAEGKVVWGKVPHGAWAYTEWQCKVQNKKASFVLLLPKTGKTHQLRVHLAGIGHPILGDRVYGTAGTSLYPRQLLHAYQVQFVHPGTGVALLVQAPLPSDFLEVGQTLFGKTLCAF